VVPELLMKKVPLAKKSTNRKMVRINGNKTITIKMWLSVFVRNFSHPVCKILKLSIKKREKR
jgi:hypothetical protein